MHERAEEAARFRDVRRTLRACTGDTAQSSVAEGPYLTVANAWAASAHVSWGLTGSQASGQREKLAYGRARMAMVERTARWSTSLGITGPDQVRGMALSFRMWEQYVCCG